jgi:TPP-dependent pyruvate/acetoin dehydrogenase alpha subunit
MNSSKLFYEMLRIRRIEEAIAARYTEQEMRCPVHLSIGQEAVAVGVCQNLLNSDYVVSGHRAHAHYLAKGGDLSRMMAEIYGKKTGCCHGHGGSMHLTDLEHGFVASTPIVGGSIPVGVGLALASKMKKESRITTIFFGEGATEEGVWAESLNFAALKKLPVLFVCEHNFYSVYSPMNVRQPEGRERVAIAKAHGIYTDSGDGNNIDEVMSKTAEAVAHIRSGKGPAFVEFVTYRYREHCGPHFDNHIGYRTEEEAALWESRCPIKRHEHLNIDMEQKIAHEIAAAFAFAKESPFPGVDEWQMKYNVRPQSLCAR